MSFNAYLDGYLRDVRSGIRKTARGRDFAEGTIYTISGTVMLLKDKGYGKARDLFIIGICTAQRVSDFTQFRKEDVFRLEDGHLYIKIIQKKRARPSAFPATAL